jgi:hypothetical protein
MTTYYFTLKARARSYGEQILFPTRLVVGITPEEALGYLRKMKLIEVEREQNRYATNSDLVTERKGTWFQTRDGKAAKVEVPALGQSVSIKEESIRWEVERFPNGDGRTVSIQTDPVSFEQLLEIATDAIRAEMREGAAGPRPILA